MRRSMMLAVPVLVVLAGCGGGGSGGSGDSQIAVLSGTITVEGRSPSQLARRMTALGTRGDQHRDDWQVAIAWQPGSAVADRAQVLSRHGLHRAGVQRGVAIACRPEAVWSGRHLYRLLAAEPSVRAVAIAAPARACYVPTDPFYTTQWNLQLIDMANAWDLSRGSSNVTIAVIDGGINLSHPDFVGRMRDGYDFISDPRLAMDDQAISAENDRDSDPTDSQAQTLGHNSHGCHVTGIATASANSSATAGIDHNCMIMPLRTLGGVSGLHQDILDALVYAGNLSTTDLGSDEWVQVFYPEGLDADRPRPSAPADIINLSLGGDFDPWIARAYIDAYDGLCRILQNKGILVVAASGNEALEPVDTVTDTNNGLIETADNIKMPAASEYVLCVGAVSSGGIARASYSNYGVELDLVAPGGETQGVPSTDFQADATGPLYLSGSSMAAPHVTGVASLLKAINPSITVDAMRQVLIDSARDLNSSGWDMTTGNGLLQANRALGAANRSTRHMAEVSDTVVALDLGEEQTTFSVRNSGGLVSDLGTLDTWSASYRSEDQRSDWISAVSMTSNGTVTVAVDRAGLAGGALTASLRLDMSGGEVVRTTVIMLDDGGNSAPPASEIDFVYVDVIDEIGNSVARDTVIFPDDSFRIVNAPAGDYYIGASTDFDLDDKLGEPGEWAGFYLPNNQLAPFSIPGGASVSGLTIDLTPVSLTSSQ